MQFFTGKMQYLICQHIQCILKLQLLEFCCEMSLYCWESYSSVQQQSQKGVRKQAQSLVFASGCSNIIA